MNKTRPKSDLMVVLRDQLGQTVLTEYTATVEAQKSSDAKFELADVEATFEAGLATPSCSVRILSCALSEEARGAEIFRIPKHKKTARSMMAKYSIYMTFF